MRIASFEHKGLEQLYQDDNAKGVPAAMADKLKKQLFAIETAKAIEDVGQLPGWRLHALKGDMEGFYSMTVSGNWRLIFKYDEASNTASKLDFKDYH